MLDTVASAANQRWQELLPGLPPSDSSVEMTQHWLADWYDGQDDDAERLTALGRSIGDAMARTVRHGGARFSVDTTPIMVGLGKRDPALGVQILSSLTMGIAP